MNPELTKYELELSSVIDSYFSEIDVKLSELSAEIDRHFKETHSICQEIINSTKTVIADKPINTIYYESYI